MEKVVNGNGDNVRIPKWLANIFMGAALSLIVGLQLNMGSRLRQIELDIATLKSIYQYQHDIINDIVKKNADNVDAHENIKDWADQSFVRKNK